MIKAPVALQDLRRKIYAKAKGRGVMAFLGFVGSRLQDGNPTHRVRKGQGKRWRPGH